MNVPLGGNLLPRIVDPENISKPLGDPLRLLSAANSATAKAKLYEPRLDSTLRVAAIAAAVTVEVENARDWRIGYSLELELDDPFAITRHEALVSGVDSGAGTITFAPALPGGSSAAKGNRIRRLLLKSLGGDSFIAMAQYGTPAESDETWGFQVAVGSTYELVGTLGAEILAEMELAATAPATKRTFFELFRIVAADR